MNIGIFGTGAVARALGAKFLELGHSVVFGTRDVQTTLARAESDGYGNIPFSQWKKVHPSAKLSTFKEAASHGEILVNATSGSGSLAALQAAGKENLKGKILIDIANPLDFSKGFPPSLTVCNTDSLAEQIQRAFPDLRVVKTLNTMNATVMVNPGFVPGDHSVFISGNDPQAKKTVTDILHGWLGWRTSNIIDLGDITTARATEMLLPIWVRLFGLLKNPNINFHIAIGAPPRRP
jgi:8-hydroxy-5-deazaflavin:NADPH oxidoreductase